MCIHTVFYILHTVQRNSPCTLCLVQPLTYVHAYCILKHVICAPGNLLNPVQEWHTLHRLWKKKVQVSWHWWACSIPEQMTHLTVALVSLLLPTSACCSAAQEKPNLLSGVSVAKFHTVTSSALNSVRATGLCNFLCKNNPNSLQPSAVL